jgi:hypothetical protein
MPLTPEGRVKQATKAVLKRENIWFFMPQNIGLGSSGVPDFICCLPHHNGKMLAIETKAPGKRSNTTALQNLQIAAIRTARGWAIVIDDVQQLEEFLDDRRAAAQGTRNQGE